MAAELRAELTASIKDLEAKLSKAEKIIQGYGKEVDRQGTKGQKGFNKVGKGAANALPATQEFSRVIQDLPFGIQGVGNNLQQLTANFGNLSKSAGGTVPAIKAMISSLAGPAGMLLAVSVVTSALTFFANSGLFKARTAAEKLADATKKATEELEKYRDSLTGVNRARLDGNVGAAKELVNLRTLRSQIENTNLTQEQRLDGIKKLQKSFPAYFSNIEQEALLNGSLEGTYKKLTNAILERAKATAAQDLLVQNAKKEFTITQQLDDLRDKSAAKELELQKAKNKGARASTNTLVGGAGSFNAKLVEQGIIQEDINNLTKEQVDLQKQLGDINKENAKLERFVTANVVVEPEINANETNKRIQEGLTKFSQKTSVLDSLFAITTEAQANLTKGSVDAVSKVSDAINAELQKQNSSPIKAYLSNIEQDLIRFNEAANEIITGGIANTFSQIGTSIGDALANGGNVLAAVGNGILQGVGDFLSKMGGLLIEYGTLAVIKGKLDLAILTGGPVAIGAGLAAIAVGVALKAAGSAIGGLATGGGANVGGQGSRSTGSNFQTGGNFNGSTSLSGRVVFEISGNKLIGVLNNTLDGNRRLGGNVSLG